MKTMTKIILILAAAFVAFKMFAGCGTSKQVVPVVAPVEQHRAPASPTVKLNRAVTLQREKLAEQKKKEAEEKKKKEDALARGATVCTIKNKTSIVKRARNPRRSNS